MQSSGSADEFDLQLINALQIAPRASWTQLGTVLDADATTLARRWRRLSDLGVARVTAFPRATSLRGQPMAYIELACRNGTVPEVAAALTADPRTLSVQFTGGQYQLLLTVSATHGLSGYLLDWIGRFPDVVTYQTHVITGIAFEATRWHVRALSAGQRRELRRLRDPEPEVATPPPVTDLDQAVLTALAPDGRASYQELAVAVGVSANTVARRLRRLLRGGVLGLRCDVARAELGWPMSVVLSGSVDMAALDRAAPDLGEYVPELRFCGTVASPANLLATLWLRDGTDLPDVERRLGERLPGMRVTDRRVVLRVIKLMGQVLDADGRYRSTVPLRFAG